MNLRHFPLDTESQCIKHVGETAVVNPDVLAFPLYTLGVQDPPIPENPGTLVAHDASLAF